MDVMPCWYTTSEGIRCDISSLSERERNVYNWLLEIFKESDSWVDFQKRTERAILEEIQILSKVNGNNGNGNYETHPLSVIQRDLLSRVDLEKNNV